MYMKVFPHGQGDGESPTNYLVREDYPGRDAQLPEVLRGDPELTRMLIDSNDKAAAKEAINEYMKAKVEQGEATNRAEVLTALQEAGLEINRAGKDYITVKDPEKGEKLRLKGGIYAER